mmetsp:Transcript_16954/g.28295  ORF Transcript_16954/g.28295 Transcript_16954/m.28295 type:complete len:117 (+) Transcript_16954:1-351(+)
MVQHGLQPSEDTKISLVGGGSNNHLWRQIIADVFQMSVQVNGHQESMNAASAVGAALQAAAIACEVPVGKMTVVLPDGNVSECHPCRDATLIGVYDTMFKRHVAISNSLFASHVPV